MQTLNLITYSISNSTVKTTFKSSSDLGINPRINSNSILITYSISI
jgi:hypothetical protein